MSEPFPVGSEARIILEAVKSDDKIVYFESCARVPLLDQIAEAIRENGEIVVVGRGGTTTRARAKVRHRHGSYENVPVGDNWATLAIGECSLDEFEEAGRAFREARRILAPKGRMVMSGPVYAGEASSTNLLTIDAIQALLQEFGFSEVRLIDLTGPVLQELSLVSEYGSLAAFMAAGKAKFVVLQTTTSRINLRGRRPPAGRAWAGNEGVQRQAENKRARYYGEDKTKWCIPVIEECASHKHHRLRVHLENRGR